MAQTNTKHEDDAKYNTILNTGNNASLILPGETPIFGAGFYGIFMLAPIFLFMLVVFRLLVIVLNAVTQIKLRLRLIKTGSAQ